MKISVTGKITVILGVTDLGKLIHDIQREVDHSG